MPSERRVDLQEFMQHLTTVRVPRRIDELVVHHTWRPTAAEYGGIATVRGIRNYHMRVRGWSDNGYHAMVAPTGEIFLCRPLGRSGAHTRGRNAHSVGVAFIANFDAEEPDQYGGMQIGVQVITALLRRFGLDERAIRFHREFAPKTCPGTKMSLAQLRQQVAAALANGQSDSPGNVRVVLLPDNAVVDCAAQIEDGTTRVTMRPLLEALGHQVHDHVKDQGKIYVHRG